MKPKCSRCGGVAEILHCGMCQGACEFDGQPCDICYGAGWFFVCSEGCPANGSLVQPQAAAGQLEPVEATRLAQ